jgi:hypothetical protein
MPGKPNTRNWNDVQTAIAMAAIVTTLGLWNLFAAPEKTVTAKAEQPTLPPTEPPVTEAPAVMPQVKIMFTQIAPQTTTVFQQTQNQTKKKKKHNNGGGGGGGSVSVTQTQSS